MDTVADDKTAAAVVVDETVVEKTDAVLGDTVVAVVFDD